MTFGQLLKHERCLSRKSQRQLAAELGISFTYLSKLENDRLPPPSGDMLMSFCEMTTARPEVILCQARRLPTSLMEALFDRPDLILELLDHRPADRRRREETK